MAHRFAFALFPIVEEGAIEAVLENRAKGGDGARLYRDAAPAGGVDARGAISSRQGEDAQAGPKALLGMGRAAMIASHKAAVEGPIFSA